MAKILKDQRSFVPGHSLAPDRRAPVARFLVPDTPPDVVCKDQRSISISGPSGHDPHHYQSNGIVRGGFLTRRPRGRHLVALSQNLLFQGIRRNGETSGQISIYTRVMCSSRCTSRGGRMCSLLFGISERDKVSGDERHQRWICAIARLLR